jgi:hypothetical protein
VLLQTLIVKGVFEPADMATVAPEGSGLVSCCPGLQSLSLGGLHFSYTLLAPLTGLNALQELNLWPGGRMSEGLEVLSELTGGYYLSFFVCYLLTYLLLAPSHLLVC